MKAAVGFWVACGCVFLGSWIPARGAPTLVGSVTGLVTEAAGNGTTNFLFELSGGQRLGIFPYEPDVIQVRWHWDGLLEKDNISVAKVQSSYPPVSSHVTNLGDRIRISTDLLHIEVETAGSARVHFRHPEGHLLLEDDRIEYDLAYEPLQDASYDNLRFTRADAQGFKVKNSKVSPSNEAYFGLGEYSGPANRRGERVQMWNSDAYSWVEGGSPMYKSFPFYYGVRPAEDVHNGFTYGVFFNNSSRTIFRMASEDPTRVSFEGGDAPLDYFFFGGGEGQSMAGVLAQYTELTGPSPMLPRWAYGYHMSKFSYDQADVENVVNTFRSNNIPLDAVYLDLDYFFNDVDLYTGVADPSIEYYDNLWQLTWNSAFPDPAAMTDFCHTQGVRVVAMVEPWLVPSDPNYADADALGLFVDDNAGNTIQTDIWMGPSSWMDYTDGDLRSWWQQKVGSFFGTHGLDGIWNDLNETADDGQIPLDALYELDGRFGSGTHPSQRWHQNVKNVHAIYQTSVSYGALEDAFPNQRPFVLSRGGFPGIQRYAAGWSGDNVANYDHLRHNIRTGVSAMMSGMVNYGHDLGGFVENSTPELVARWHEWGVLNPFCRNHYSKFDPAKEPYRYTGVIRQTLIDSIRFRYRLMPYLYTLAERSTRDGMPMNTPTVMHFPGDTNTYSRNDNEFMVGEHLLAAPVVEQGVVTRSVYLPAGTDWYHWESGERYAGGEVHTVYAPLGRLPFFARSGSIIPMGPEVQTLDNYRPDRLTIRIWPADGASFTLYEDDGISLAYQTNGSARTAMSLARTHTGMVFQTAARTGAYDPGARTLTLDFHDVDMWPGDAVRHTGLGLLEEYSDDPAAMESQPAGWRYDLERRTLTVKVPDASTGVTVRVEQRDATDADGDDIPDWWEINYGFNPSDPADADGDADADGRTQREEYRGQTDPRVADPYGFASGFEQISIAGPFTGWNPGRTNFFLIDDYTWQGVVVFTNEPMDRFKFTANGSFATNWGEANQTLFDLPLQGVAESGGEPDIQVNGSLDGPVRFTFHEQTGIYQVERVLGPDRDGDGLPDAWEESAGLHPLQPGDADADVDGDGATAYQEFLRGRDPGVSDPPTSVYPSMTLAGDFTGWNVQASNMILVADNTWQFETRFAAAQTLAFKFAANGTWAVNWGDTGQEQILAPLAGTAVLGSSENLQASIQQPGPVRFTFNDQSLAYQVVPVQTLDRDADGLSDDWEESNGLDPTNGNDAALDADGDGLSARLEALRHGNPGLADTDGDGANDFNEWIAGTRLNDPSDLLAGSIRRIPAGIELQWPTVTGRTYTLYRSTHLLGPWTNHPSDTSFPGQGHPVTLPITNPPTPTYFRLNVSP